MQLKKDCKIIFFPKHMLWYRKDFGVDSPIEQLEFINNHILTLNLGLKQRIDDVIDEMRQNNNQDDYHYEYECFDWKFDAESLPGGALFSTVLDDHSGHHLGSEME